jgi:MFS family permease
VGAFFGMIIFSQMAQRWGRKPAFTITYLAGMVSTAAVFLFLNSFHQVFWMIPIMGCCVLGLFAGYAIYFPELFPTTLRSTGTSFCYNVGRYVGAFAPSLLGLLTTEVFSVENGFKEGIRYAGLAMCSVFLLGLVVLPFAPETRGKPLPEEVPV